MCGLAGVWMPSGAQGGKNLKAIALAMATALIHRGPDDAGGWADRKSGLALSHRRLSIVDLSPAGHQPMVSADENLVLVFNGEIYNHLQLRRELEQSELAPDWRGHSDTETLLASFAAWGFAATLRKAVGMFALALWDGRTETLQLARDRMGEKPLYYGWVGGGFAFASELKALRQVPGFDNPVDRDALALYMQFCAVPAPYSIYRDIGKLLPGATLTLSRADVAARRLPAPVIYWSAAGVARQGLAQPLADEEEAVTELERLLRLSLSGQMVADVPLGAFLSGGIDSCTIVALMQSQATRPVKTFTIGFQETSFDESAAAAAVARHLGTDHHEIRVAPTDALGVIPSLPDFYDEPFADSSQIPTFLVSRAARAQVTVALSGDGGDELFGGYNRYRWARRIWSRLSWLPHPARRVLGGSLCAIPLSAWDRVSARTPYVRGLGDMAHKLGRRLQKVRDMDDLYRGLITEWPADSGVVTGAEPLLIQLDDKEQVADIADPEHRMMLLDMLGYLPNDILTKIDRAAMACSLETRVPFLDQNVVEFAWRVPLAMKIRGGQGKWVLRQVLHKYVPRPLVERPKAGFAIPVGAWLRGPLRNWAEALLDAARLKREGYFDPAQVRQKWDEHLSGRRDWTPSLWCVLMFGAWLERQAS